MTNDIDGCVQAIMDLSDKRFLFLAGIQWELSDDHSRFRAIRFPWDFSKDFDKEEIDFDLAWADRLNV